MSATFPPDHRVSPPASASVVSISTALSDHEAQTEWALGIKNAIANYLQEGPDGKFYYRMVDTVLSRDKNWVRWKMENCQPFTRKRVDTSEFTTSKSDAVRAVSSKRPKEPTVVSGSLNFLYNTEAEKGLSQLRQRGRYARSITSLPYISADACQIQRTECGNLCKEGQDDRLGFRNG